MTPFPEPLAIPISSSSHGPEFEGHDFQFSLDYAGIKTVNISPNTPTTENSIIEVTHKLIGQVIRTLINLKPPQDKAAAEHLVDKATGIPMHALRCNPISTLGNHSPGPNKC